MRPDPEYVYSFAERMRTEWGNQQKLDDAQLSYINYQNLIDTFKPKEGGNPSVKGFRSGIGGLIVKEDAALLTGTPGIHVNVPTEDEKDKRHASELLEPWLTGAWKLSQQAGQVWDRKPLSLRSIGRSWDNIYPFPKLWKNSEYDGLVQEYRSASEAEDSEKASHFEREIQKFKRDRFPIRWRHVDPRQTWTVFNGEIWLPEVVEIRKMTKDQLKAEFGDDSIGEYGDKKYAGSHECDVYEYADWEWCLTVIGGSNAGNAGILREFEHSLGMSPYDLCEAELLPDNDNKWRWAGALFYAQSMIDTFDELMSDLRENHRDNTRTATVIRVDPEREDDPKNVGRPPQLKIEPGGQLTIWKTEEVLLAPVPQLNPQSIQLLQEVKQLVYQNMIRPVERGEAKSGTSQNQFVTAVQIAEREFDPSMRALVRSAENTCKRFMRSVQSLNKQFPGDPDKVALFGEWKTKSGKKEGVIEVGPDDVRGWENAVQCRLSRAIPIDRNLILNQAVLETNLQLAEETILEETLGYENPYDQIRKRRRSQMAEAMFQTVVLPAGVQWAQGQLLAPTPGELQQVQQQLPGASPDLQAFAQQLGMVPGGILQAAANERRAGVPQVPQVPQEAVTAGGEY